MLSDTPSLKRKRARPGRTEPGSRSFRSMATPASASRLPSPNTPRMANLRVLSAMRSVSCRSTAPAALSLVRTRARASHTTSVSPSV